VYTEPAPWEHSTRHLGGEEPGYGPDFWQPVFKDPRQLSDDGLQSPGLDSPFKGLVEEPDPVHPNLLWKDLERLGLHEAVRATCYGIRMSVVNFYAMLELCCPSTRTFFTHVGELGMALHEM